TPLSSPCPGGRSTPPARRPARVSGENLVISACKFGPRATRFGKAIACCIGKCQSTAATRDLATKARMALPPAEPIAPPKRPSGWIRIIGVIDERGRLPGATALAAGRPSASRGEKEKSVIWLLRKKPSTIRPDPKMLSTVVVIDTTLPAAS